jgi:anti-sigma factor RsiW
MTHLGDRLSALIDGELNGADLDRATGHLAACDECRVEAAALRDVKRELRALGTVPAEAAAVRRLVAMAGPGGPIPPRRPVTRVLPGGPRRRRRRHPVYAVAGAVGMITVGIGAAAFSVGGGSGIPAPRITPPIQMYSVEHAITTGDVPYPEPTGGGTAASRP